MAKVPKINNAHGPDTRNIINRAIDVLNQLGISVRDLVAEGQLTEEQYATLINTIEGHLKSGEVDYFDLATNLRKELDKIDVKIDKGDVSYLDLHDSIVTELNKINNKVDRGNISVNDINKNLGKMDSTFFTTQFLTQLNDGVINTTNLLDDSVENRHLVNGAVDYENISDVGVEGLNFESAIREFYGVSKNLILNPPGELHLTTYASQVEDIYYHSMQSHSTPSLSMTSDMQIFLPPQTGYFFYRLKVVGELLNKRVISFIVQNSNPETKVGIRFMTSDFSQIGSTIFPDRKPDGIYGFENITIPSNANVIEFRADNRGNSSNTTVTNPIVVASPRINLRDGYINELKEYARKIQADLEQYKIIDADKLPPIKVTTPANFSLKNTELSNRIYYDGKDTFMTDYDVSESKREIGTVYYVDFENGTNSNDGLTPQTPFKTMVYAMSRTDIGEMKLKGGNHYRYNAALPTINKNINITSYDGVARVIPTDRREWVKTSGYANVYQVSRNGSEFNVLDLSTSDGDGYSQYKNVDSISAVNATSNSWHHSNGNMYIHHKNIPSPDELVIIIGNQNIQTTNNVEYIYLEGIEFIGGRRPIRAVTDNLKFYAKDCKFLHGLQVNGNGLEIVGGVSSICQNVIAAHNPMDGFNYHIGENDTKPYMIEIDCKGVDNGQLKGTGGSRSDNGSTLHDGLKGIRLNGYYGYNDGGNIADVNAGTESWNLNCVTFDSYQSYDIIVNGGTKIFLDNVSAIGSARSIISQSIDDEVYIRRGKFGVKEIAGTEIRY